MQVYVLTYIFMWVHVWESTHMYVPLFVWRYMCRHVFVCVCVHMEAVCNLRCHSKTLLLGLKSEALTDLELT